MENMGESVDKKEVSLEKEATKYIDLNKDVEAGTESAGGYVECRICQEEDFIQQLETPCKCKGTLQFAHRDCIQKWINERQALICEICNQAYGSDFSITVVRPPIECDTNQPEDVTIGIMSESYFAVDTALPRDMQFQGPRAAHAQAEAAAASEFLRMQQLNVPTSRFNGFGSTSLCRIGAIICLAFLVVKDAYYFYQHGGDGDLLTIICVFLGFFLPCYLLAWFANVWYFDRNQGDGRLAMAEVAVVPQLSSRR